MRSDAQKINAQATILLTRDGMSIELFDKDARVTFARVELSPEQACSALGRLSNTDCVSAEVYGLDRVGKVHEHQMFEFPMPDDASLRHNRDAAITLVQANCPKGWEPDTCFVSQGSFFVRNGKLWARTLIRRWVPKEEVKS